MTEKRYYTHKHRLKENQVHDKICHRFMNIDETVDHMNICYQKYVTLKKENEQLKQQKEFCEKEAIDLIREQRKFIDDLSKENEQLKQEIESDEFLIKIYENFLEKRGYDVNDVVTGLYDIKKR